METLQYVLAWLSQNKELVGAALTALLALLKLTDWGQANAEALGRIVAVIESLEAKGVKKELASGETALSPAARDALRDAVAVADPKKTAPGVAQVIVREILRGLVPRR